MCAASTAFADSVQINKHFDLVFVPGLLLTDSITAYLKLGLSVASLRDNLASPVGYTPVNGNFNSSKTKAGFAGGIGVKKAVTDHLDVFAEGNYHDYGSVTFANFQNFSADYSHTAHVYSSAVTAGLAYNF